MKKKGPKKSSSATQFGRKAYACNILQSLSLPLQNFFIYVLMCNYDISLALFCTFLNFNSITLFFFLIKSLLKLALYSGLLQNSHILSRLAPKFSEETLRLLDLVFFDPFSSCSLGYGRIFFIFPAPPLICLFFFPTLCLQSESS